VADPAIQLPEKIVYSKTLPAPSSRRTRIEGDFDPKAIRHLKATARADITVGGAALAAQALGAGLVDELQLFLVPVLIGPESRLFLTTSSLTSNCWTSGDSRAASCTSVTASSHRRVDCDQSPTLRDWLVQNGCSATSSISVLWHRTRTISVRECVACPRTHGEVADATIT